MKRILSLLLTPLMACCLVSFDRAEIPPEGRMPLTALSDKILLVEITKVTLTDEEVRDGIAYREIKVEGKIVEVIRGKEEAKEFKSSWEIFRVVDGLAALTKHGAQAMDMLAGGSYKTGIEECKEGKRYVVIFPSELPFPTLFSEITKENSTWMKEIRPRVDPLKPVLRTPEPAKKGTGST